MKATMVMIGLTALASASVAVFAQENLVGRYSGNYLTTQGTDGGNTSSIGVTLEIQSIQNDMVKATATHTGRACGDTYPMEGKLQDNKLALRSTKKGGRAGDCSFSLNLTAEGTRLVGTVGRNTPVTLSK